jgi:hypothetical protein
VKVKVHSHFKLSSFGLTWVFDAATKKWHEEAWYDTNGVQHRTLDTFKAYAYGTNVSLDWKTGALYQRDTTNFTDNGVACVYSHDFRICSIRKIAGYRLTLSLSKT